MELSVFSYKNAEEFDNLTEATRCFDIILKTRFKNTNAQTFGKQFYFPPIDNKPILLNDGMELWRGLFQSTIMGTKSLYLNADVLNKAVPSEVKLLDYLATLNRGQVPATLQYNQMEILKEHLKQLRLLYQAKPSIPGRFKQFYQLGKSAKEQKFEHEGKQITVEQYFKQKDGLKIQLKYPNLPLIQVLPADKKIFLPMEFCTIPGGQLNQKKCTDKCLQVMIKQTAVSTDERKRLIKESSESYALKEDGKAFGIEISNKFEQVMARIINKPSIVYAGNKQELPSETTGTWRSGNFVRGFTENIFFGVISSETLSSQVLNALKDDIVGAAGRKRLPMNGQVMQLFDVGRANPTEVTGFLSESLQRCKDSGINLVFFIINGRNDCYSEFKKIAETQVGIMTQCLTIKTFYNQRETRYNMSPKTMDQIFLKINTMFNGMNHQMNEPSYNQTTKTLTMFIGADVTHPTPERRDVEPSVAAVCASFEPSGFLYHPVWRIQKAGSDHIVDFESIMDEQLRFFAKRNGNKMPSKIIYYRDGVGESQFDNFVGSEIESMKRACQKIYPRDRQPPITVLIVNKRHHMRAFPLSVREGGDGGDGSRFNNIRPGTVLDKDIVSPKYFQFFLASHAAIQGVSKPAKYTVILNECKISADDMQALTYCLCHMYIRVNRSVSYPNCTYYAHLFAFRAKHYIQGVDLKPEEYEKKYQECALKSEIVNDHPMFFI